MDKEQIFDIGSDKLPENVPFAVYEKAMIRAEQREKVHWKFHIIEAVSIVLLVIAFFFYLSLYDFESYEVTAEGDGHANYIGQDGDIYNGSESISQKESTQERTS